MLIKPIKSLPVRRVNATVSSVHKRHLQTQRGEVRGGGGGKGRGGGVKGKEVEENIEGKDE